MFIEELDYEQLFQYKQPLFELISTKYCDDLDQKESILRLLSIVCDVFDENDLQPLL